MTNGSLEVMIGKLDERSIRTLEMMERFDVRMMRLEEEITSLKVSQETIQSASNLEDEKIRSMVNVNSIKTSGLTTAVILLLQYIFTHLK
jgi:hypothetical protein